VVAILKELGSFEYAAALLRAQTMRCRSLLASLPASHARNALEELIGALEVRKE
jgi:geranylgeranyl pyrophosphate synthase